MPATVPPVFQRFVVDAVGTGQRGDSRWARGDIIWFAESRGRWDGNALDGVRDVWLIQQHLRCRMI